MLPDPLFFVLGVPVYFYIIAYVASFGLAFILALVLTREHGGIPFKDLLAASVACIIVDLALSPILALVMEQLNLPVPLNWSAGQLVVVLGALALYHVMMRRRVHVAFSDRLDIAAAPVMLCIVILRLGCLAAGCCYGIPAPGLPWAITFTNPHAISIYKNIPVHPTQLYESISALAILGIALALRRRAMWRGNLMWLALLLYAGIRFVIEFCRGDPSPMIDVLPFVLSLNQIMCVALAVVCGSILAWKFNRLSVVGTVEA